MRKHAVFAALALVFAAHAGATELIANGSFEAGSLVANYVDPGARRLLPGDSGTLAGWTVIGNYDIAWIGAGNPYQLGAAEGNNFLDLTGWHDQSGQGAGVKQTIATVAGARYTLSFDQGNSYTYNYGNADTLFVSAGDQNHVEFSAPGTTQAGVWTHQTLSFSATGSSTDISFAGGQAVWYIGLDNVSVAAAPVPEPSEALMLGVGLMGLALAVRRRRSRREG